MQNDVPLGQRPADLLKGVDCCQVNLDVGLAFSQNHSTGGSAASTEARRGAGLGLRRWRSTTDTAVPFVPGRLCCSYASLAESGLDRTYPPLVIVVLLTMSMLRACNV